MDRLYIGFPEAGKISVARISIMLAMQGIAKTGT
jgi:hypothetical protein